MKMFSKLGNRQGMVLWVVGTVLLGTSGVYPQGGSATPGMRRGGGNTPMDRAASRQEAAMEKNQQLQAEATPVIQAMGDQVKELLTMVNEMRRPDPARLTLAEQSLKESGRYVRKFDQNIQCEYSMLEAWLKYFRNDIPGATMSASTAFKTDGTNNDARVTFATMSILAGRRPTGVVVKKEVPTTTGNERADQADRRRQMADQQQQQQQQRNRNRPNDPAEQLLTATPSTGAILQVDVDALKPELFDQKIPALQAQCINSTNFTYTPGQSGLCLLFWQARPKNFVATTPAAGRSPGEPNLPGTAPRPGQRNAATAARRDPMNNGDNVPTDRRGNMAPRGRAADPRGMGMSDPGYGVTTPGYAGTGTRTSLDTEIAAVGQMFQAHYADADLKFLGVNTDNPAAKKEAVARMVQSPTPWAQVFASDPQSGLSQFARVEAETPVLAIVDKNGAIRYAGPAAGFLAPLVLEHLGTIGSASPMAAPAAIPAGTAPAPTTPALPTAPKPQATTPAPAVPAPAKPAPNTMANATLEDIEPTEEELTNDPTLFEAAKKLEYAKTLFIPAGQKRFMTSKNGVETCREILRRWPNTKYAEGARQLLRKIPPDEQKRYKITNEELGL